MEEEEEEEEEDKTDAKALLWQRSDHTATEITALPTRHPPKMHWPRADTAAVARRAGRGEEYDPMTGKLVTHGWRARFATGSKKKTAKKK